MIRQLRDETWILRHRVKVVAQAVVDRFYGIHASPEYLMSARSQEEEDAKARRFTRERVKDLIDKKSRFLCAPEDTDVSVYFFPPDILIP